MNNIDLLNTIELEDKFSDLSSLYSFYDRYNFFFSPFFLFTIIPFFNFLSLFFSNRVYFLIYAFSIFFNLYILFKHLFLKKIFSKFSIFSLTNDYTIKDISMFFLYKKDNNLKDTILKYFLFEAKKNQSNFQHLQNILSNKNNHLFLTDDHIKSIQYSLTENFFHHEKLFNKLFLIKNKSSYMIIFKSIFENNHHNLNYFNSTIIHFDYLIENILQLTHDSYYLNQTYYSYYFKINYSILLNVIFRFPLEYQKQLLDKLCLFIKENEENRKINVFLKLQFHLEKHILKLDIKSF